MVDLEKLKDSLISGDIEKTEELTGAALDAGVPPKEILDKGLIPGLNEVGSRFQEGEYFFPELLAAGATCWNTTSSNCCWAGYPYRHLCRT